MLPSTPSPLLPSNAPSTDLFSIYRLPLSRLPRCFTDLAFGLPALTVLSLFLRVICCQVISSPSWSTLLSHLAALSAPPSRLPTSVVIRYLSSGRTACSFAKRLATHLLSGRRCHPISSSLSSFLRTLLSLRHFLHLAYRWSIDCPACLHDQHSAISVTHILSRKNTTAPCLTLSWKNHEPYLFDAYPSTRSNPGFQAGNMLALTFSFSFFISNLTPNENSRVFSFSYFPLYIGQRAPPCGLGSSICGCLFSGFICSFFSFNPTMACIYLTITYWPWVWSCLACLWN